MSDEGPLEESAEDQHEFALLSQQISKRTYWRKQPRPGSQSISQMIAKKGYGQTTARQTVDEYWKQEVGDTLCSKSKPGILRRGVLEVIVQNSSVMQELVFQKRQILRKFEANDQTRDIIDLKFKVGAS